MPGTLCPQLSRRASSARGRQNACELTLQDSQVAGRDIRILHYNFVVQQLLPDSGLIEPPRLEAHRCPCSDARNIAHIQAAKPAYIFYAEPEDDACGGRILTCESPGEGQHQLGEFQCPFARKEWQPRVTCACGICSKGGCGKFEEGDWTLRKLEANFWLKVAKICSQGSLPCTACPGRMASAASQDFKRQSVELAHGRQRDRVKAAG